MDRIFITILNMSITASCIIVALLVLRLALKRNGAPQWIVCALWAVVFFRLLCPVTFTSNYSLLHFLPQNGQIKTGLQMEYVASDLYVQQLPLEIPPVESADKTLARYPEGDTSQFAPVEQPVPMEVNVLILLPYLWLIGLIITVVCDGYGWYSLCKRIDTATLVDGNIYESDKTNGPFVLGVWRPRIYLPLGLAGEERQYILLHEQSHIQRGDLWWKTLSRLALLLHWFNPLVHLAFYLFAQDLEQACDEKVVAQLDSDKKAAYSRTLLNLSMGRQRLAVPLAFSESKTKGRIKNILQYRKPAMGTLIVFTCIAAMIGIACISNPAALPKQRQLSENFQSDSMLQQVYWDAQQINLTELYQILLLDDPLLLERNVNLRIYDKSERKGIFSFYTKYNMKDKEVVQQAGKKLQQYLLAAMIIFDLHEGSIDIYYGSRAVGGTGTVDGGTLTDLLQRFPEPLDAYCQNKAGLKRLLQQLHVEQAEEKVSRLWNLVSKIKQEKKQNLAVQEEFQFYDMQCERFGWSKNLGERIQTLSFTINKSEQFFNPKKTESDY